MKEAFRLQTDFSSSFDRWVSSFVSDHPAQLEWTTLKELIHEYTTTHTNDSLPTYISSALTYYAQRVSTTNRSEIVIFENVTISYLKKHCNQCFLCLLRYLFSKLISKTPLISYYIAKMNLFEFSKIY